MLEGGDDVEEHKTVVGVYENVSKTVELCEWSSYWKNRGIVAAKSADLLSFEIGI